MRCQPRSSKQRTRNGQGWKESSGRVLTPFADVFSLPSTMKYNIDHCQHGAFDLDRRNLPVKKPTIFACTVSHDKDSRSHSLLTQTCYYGIRTPRPRVRPRSTFTPTHNYAPRGLRVLTHLRGTPFYNSRELPWCLPKVERGGEDLASPRASRQLVAHTAVANCGGA